RRLGIVAAALALTTLGGLALVLTGPVTAQRPANGVAPRFQVDPWWPKPLPNNWLMGQAAGVAVDRHDHVWVIQRPRSLPAHDTAHLGRPAHMSVDPATNELFVADGYKNHRVIVFHAQTGAYKRHWGANGRPPGEPGVKPFGNPVHCVRLARDGLLYVCDRMNNRIQVLKKDGSFVNEFIVAPTTRGNGSGWDLDVYPDAPQTWLYHADGESKRVSAALPDS